MGIDHLVRDLHAAGEYRPTAVGVLVRHDRYLLAKPRGYDVWMFVQGGIRPGERTEDAYRRELHEELGADPERLCTIHPAIYHEPLDFGLPVRGFSRGKAFIHGLLEYDGNDLALGDELDAAGWFPYEGAHMLLGTAAPERARIARRALEEAHLIGNAR